MKRIYVAGKLNADAVGYIQNLHRMFKVAEEVRLLGCAVFIPGLDFLMGVVMGNWTYEDYFENSQPWLDAADAVFVGPDWEGSEGTNKELSRAHSKGIPVFFDLHDLADFILAGQ